MPAVNIQLAARKYDLPAECWQVFEQQPVKIRFFCPADAGERALASDTLHTSADRSGTGASTPSSPFPSQHKAAKPAGDCTHRRARFQILRTAFTRSVLLLTASSYASCACSRSN